MCIIFSLIYIYTYTHTQIAFSLSFNIHTYIYIWNIHIKGARGVSVIIVGNEQSESTLYILYIHTHMQRMSLIAFRKEHAQYTQSSSG